jgi:hypothetical protein
MTWIIILALLGLAATVIRRRNKTITDLKADVDRWQTQFRESREGKDATITALNRDLQQLRADNIALREKLDNLLHAAMRFCSQANGIYRRKSLHKLAWQTRAHELDERSGAIWTWSCSQGKISEWAQATKPTVESWIAFANDVSAYAEADNDGFGKYEEKLASLRTRRRNLMVDSLKKLLTPHQAMISGPGGGLSAAAVEKDLDLRLLQFLDGFRWLIEVDHQDGSHHWDVHNVQTVIDGTSIQGNLLRRKLMDLVTHHNAEYVMIIDRFPPDIAQYFLRLTVAEPVAAAG